MMLTKNKNILKMSEQVLEEYQNKTNNEKSFFEVLKIENDELKQ